MIPFAYDSCDLYAMPYTRLRKYFHDIDEFSVPNSQNRPPYEKPDTKTDVFFYGILQKKKSLIIWRLFTAGMYFLEDYII